MSHSREHVRHEIAEEYESPELLQTLQWDIKEHPTLDGASRERVRTMVRILVTSQMPLVSSRRTGTCRSPLQQENPRYTYCIQVDAASLKSFICRATPYECPSVHGKGAFINLVNGDDMHELDIQTRRHQARCPWDHPDLDDMIYGKDPDPWDEGEEGVDRCRLYNVGCAKVGGAGLCPEIYALSIDDDRWHTHYCRPPGNMHCWRVLIDSTFSMIVETPERTEESESYLSSLSPFRVSSSQAIGPLDWYRQCWQHTASDFHEGLVKLQ